MIGITTRTKWLFAVAALFCATTISAQNYKLEVNCPETVGTMTEFKIDITVTADTKDIQVNVKNPISISNVRTSSNHKVKNSSGGKMKDGVLVEESTVVHSYTYKSDKEGSIVIAPVTLEVIKDGQVVTTLTTERKSIAVKAGYVSSSTGNNPVSATGTSTLASTGASTATATTAEGFKPIYSIMDIESSDVIIKWSTSRSAIELGDTIQCYCDVYSLINTKGVECDTTGLFPNCKVENFKTSQKNTDIVDMFGKEYHHNRAISCTLTPQKVGVFEVGGGQVNANIVVTDTSNIPEDAIVEENSKVIQYTRNPYKANFRVRAKRNRQ